jgi:hypothetical protein
MSTLWPFDALPGYTETLRWNTAAMTTYASEQRQALMPYPDVELTFQHDMDPEEFAKARQLERLVGIGEFQIPLWEQCDHVGAISAHDVDISIATADKDYVAGGYLMAWSAHTFCEACLIDSFDSDSVTLDPWIAGPHTNAWVCPLVNGRLVKPLSVQRRDSPSAIVSSTFLLSTATALTPIGYPQYRTHELTLFRAHKGGSDSETFAHQSVTLAAAGGAQEYAEKRAEPELTSGMSWLCRTRAETQELRAWLHGRLGSCVSFWRPSWNQDVTITKAIGIGDTTIEINAVEFHTLYTNPTDFAIIKTDGTAVGFRATGASGAVGGKENITLDAATTVAVPLAEIRKTSRIALVRLASDSVEIRHIGNGQSECSVGLVEVFE